MAQLNIVRASAGSGKTFRLTLEYLSHLYNNTDDYSHILAVTFTNKATEEMKSRIIRVLSELAGGKSCEYLQPLLIITGRSEKEIRLKSDIILKKILHNYSRFSVSTIDSFFQHIIRSFIREIGIQGGYRIEMNDDLILQKAIDNLFTRIEEDKALLNWLTEFTESKIEGSQSWNMKREMTRLGREIFKEGYKQFSENINRKLHDKNFLSDYRKELFRIKNTFESILTGYGKDGVEAIEHNGLLVDDFFQKSKGPAGYFYRLAAGDIPEPNSYVLKAFHDIEIWSKQENPGLSLIRKVCEDSLHPLLQKVIRFYLDNKKEYKTAETLLKNFYTLGILTDITKSVYHYTREKNLFMISDSAQFINRIIDNNDTPFIYEKTGNYFHHFLIDEFQDTSGFQWKNFKPLISNSLSQDYSCLVVGDVKQSIYRWRNSNWEILAYDILDDFYSGAIHSETLEINWRSKKNIVLFNNAFFNVASKILHQQFSSESETDDETNGKSINNLYADIKQNLPERTPDGGYIRIGLLDDSLNYDNTVCIEVVKIIKQLQDSGYSPNDIAIITRSKKEGKKMADYLLGYHQNQEPGSRYQFNVISDESLFLNSSVVVRFIISLFRHIVEPEDHVNNYFMLYEYLNYIHEDGDRDPHVVIPDYNAQSAEKSIKAILPEAYHQFLDNQVNISLYEITQEIIRIFLLNEIRGEQAFLMAFKDLIIDYTDYNSSGLPAFLDYWDETGSQKAIPGTEEQNAIRILTIHKSKGLEFNVVIIPFCNWKMDQSNTVIWCQPRKEPFSMMDIVPVDYTRALKETIFEDDYQNERLKIYTDNLNLLYVAFTRTRKALYCFAQEDTRKSGDPVNNVSQLIFKVLKTEELTGPDIRINQNEGIRIFEKGFLEIPDKKDDTINKSYHIEDYPENNTIDRMKIAYHAREYLEPGDDHFQPLSYGKIMHDLFSRIYAFEDIDSAIETLYYQGKIGDSEKEIIKKDLLLYFSDIQVRSWFSGEWMVLNERDILTKSAQTRRPDRVLIQNRSAIIVDYKFGDMELKEHKEQVMEYADLLKQMGYEQVELYLWYVTKRKIIQITA